jgi:hypothetical protein
MPRDTFEISFDRHGHILVENAELARRLVYLLQHDRKLVMRLVGDQTDPDSNGLPNGVACLVPERVTIDERPILNGKLCPNSMCVCGALQIVLDDVFQQQFRGLGDEMPGR